MIQLSSLFNNDKVSFIKKISIQSYQLYMFELSDQPSNEYFLNYQIPKGQIFLRKYINENHRKNIIPWCFIQIDKFNNLSLDAILYWKMYSFEPKKIIIFNNKIIAIKAVINSYNEIHKKLLKFNLIKKYKAWLDISNNSYINIPFFINKKYKNYKIKIYYEISEYTGAFNIINKTIKYSNDQIYFI